jgi:hypothetical protein
MHKTTKEFFDSEKKAIIKSLLETRFFNVNSPEEFRDDGSPVSLIIEMIYKKYIKSASYSADLFKNMSEHKSKVQIRNMAYHLYMDVLLESTYQRVTSLRHLLLHSDDGVVNIRIIPYWIQHSHLAPSSSGLRGAKEDHILAIKLKADDPLCKQHGINDFSEYLLAIFDKKITLEQESCESNILSFNLNDYKDSSAYVQKLLNFFSLKKRYDSIMSSVFDDISDFTISNEMSNFKILSAKNEIDDLQKQCSDAISRINELNAIIEEQRMLSTIELENIKKNIIANNNFPEADFNKLKEIFE